MKLNEVQTHIPFILTIATRYNGVHINPADTDWNIPDRDIDNLSDEIGELAGLTWEFAKPYIRDQRRRIVAYKRRGEDYEEPEGFTDIEFSEKEEEELMKKATQILRKYVPNGVVVEVDYDRYSS